MPCPSFFALACPLPASGKSLSPRGKTGAPTRFAGDLRGFRSPALVTLYPRQTNSVSGAEIKFVLIGDPLRDFVVKAVRAGRVSFFEYMHLGDDHIPTSERAIYRLNSDAAARLRGARSGNPHRAVFVDCHCFSILECNAEHSGQRLSNLVSDALASTVTCFNFKGSAGL